MGYRTVHIMPELLQELFTTGYEVGVKHAIRCTEGIPESAAFVRGWYEANHHPDGEFVLLFSSDEWAAQLEGTPYQALMPVYTTEHFEEVRK